MNGLAACIGLAAALGNTSPPAAVPDTTQITDPAYTRPGRLVEVAPGRRLNLRCAGSGLPAVVFEAGLGDGSKAWGLVQPAIAVVRMACSYDRAGLGFSDASTRPGTSANAVSDLRRLLHAARIPPPYVLVGHSYGGMHVKLYAQRHPAEVAGLVLVDPSPEDLGREIARIDPASDARHHAYLAELQQCLQASAADLADDTRLQGLCVGQAGPRYSAAINAVELRLGQQPARVRAWISELAEVWTRSAAQARAAERPLGAIPIVVLSKPPGAPGATETAAQRAAKNQAWQRLHERIAALSSRGRRITVEGAGHYIQHDQPQAVIEAVLEVVEEVAAVGQEQ